MNYFKVLGIIFGLAALLKPVYMHLIPWDENKFLRKAYAEKRPRWILIVSLIGIVLISFTWYKHFTEDVPHSIVITVLFSLLAIKTFTLLFNYKTFQKWVTGMLNKKKGKDIIIIDILTSLFGLLVIVLTLIFY